VKKHKKLLIVLGLLVIAGYMTWTKIQEQQEKVAALMQNQIQTAVIEKRSILSYVSTTGKVESVESRDITSSLNGRDIDDVLVEVGDVVQEGDLLVVFDTGDILDDIAEVNEDLSKIYTDISNTNEQNQIALDQAQRSYDAAQVSNEEQSESMSDQVEDAQKKLSDAMEDKLVYEKQRIADEAYVTAALDAWNEVKEEYEKMKLEYEELSAAVTQAQTNLTDAQSVLKMAQIDLDEFKKDHEDDFDEQTGKILEDASHAAYRLNKAVEKAQESADYCQTEYEKANMNLNELKDEYTDATTIYNQLQSDYEQAVSAWTATENQLETQRDLIESLEDSLEDVLDNQITQERNNANSLQNSQEQIELQRISGSNSIRNLEDQVSSLEDKISDYQKDLGKTEIRAPFSGMITDVKVDPGDTYELGRTLITIQDTNELIIATQVDEYDISTLKEGMRAVIKTDATREDELEGKITFLAPIPTENTNSVTYRVEISLEKQDERLRLGMTAKTNIILEDKENVVTVPYESILTDEEGNNYVTLVERAEDGTTSQRNVTVTVGTEGDYYVEVSSEEELEGKEVLIPTSGGNALEDLMSLMGE